METTRTLNEQTIEGLQDLIKINYDSCAGFRSAADNVESSEIASLFRHCATEREKNAQELRGYVQMNDRDAEDSGSIKGTVHRWWMEVRDMVSSDDEHAMLAEAERGEDAIKDRYEDVLKETPGSAVNDVLMKQYAQVKARHDQIRDMRDARA